MVVTKRNGENPSVKTSAFFLFSLLFLLLAAFQVQSAGEKERSEMRRWVGESYLLFGVQVFLKSDRPCLELLLCEVCKVS